MSFKSCLFICCVIMFINHSILISQQNLTPTSSFLGTHNYERAGYHLHSAGDVNGDGYDDFLIGTFHNWTNGYNAGAAYLFLGSQSANWGYNISLLNADARFLGATPYESAGYFLGGGGDINGDGLDDFLIGAEGGFLYIVLGRSNANWGTDFVLFDSADAQYEEENAEDGAGMSTAIIGDLNGDGYDDIICGAPFNDYGGTDAGKVYIILGKASGWQRGDHLSNADASFYGSYSSGAFGYCVDGVGDVNGDNIPDFAIGARNQGKVFLFFGRRSVNWGQNYDADNADVIFLNEQYGNYTGWRVSGVGDVNGDGYDDFVIGAPYHDEFDKENGKVYLILGRSSGWKPNLSEADASYYGEGVDDQAGWDTQGAGDVDGDGYDDFLIGAWYNDSNGDDSGKMYLIKGKPSGWQRNVSLAEIEDYFVGEDTVNYVGYSCSNAGDVNNDGLSDIITSASYYSEAYYWGGKIYIFVSQNSIPPPITDSHASIMGENILLEWSSSTVTTIYNIYRNTNYDFDPDSANRIGYHISDEDPNKIGIQWTDTGNGADIVGDVTKNYFYKVTAVAAVESEPSNVAAEFDYNLITTNGTDINEIVVLMDIKKNSVPITKAEELAQAIPYCSDVYYWDAQGQGTVGHPKGVPFNNFNIIAGFPYIVNITSDTVWTLAGSFLDTSFHLITTDGTDINHISVPLNKDKLTTAEELGQDIPDCSDVYYWNTEGQGTVGHVVGLPFENFAVRAGYPYYVNVTANTIWPYEESESILASQLMMTRGLSQQPKQGLVSSGVPHTVYGNVVLPGDQDFSADNFKVRAWIIGRAEEIVGNEKSGSGCNGGYWWIAASNFVTAWQAGDSLQVEIADETGRFKGETIVVLTDAGSDPGGEIYLSELILNDASLPGLPQKFVLNQNYPNPFNPETVISFQLPESRTVILKVYNLLGAEICTLVNEKKEAGYHRIIWNGKDEMGQEIPTGVYLFKIEAGDFCMNRKMVKLH